MGCVEEMMELTTSIHDGHACFALWLDLLLNLVCGSARETKVYGIPYRSSRDKRDGVGGGVKYRSRRRSGWASLNDEGQGCWMVGT